MEATITLADIVALLEEKGFTMIEQRGDDHVWARAEDGRFIILPSDPLRVLSHSRLSLVLHALQLKLDQHGRIVPVADA